MELNLTGGFFGFLLLILDIHAIVKIVGSGASTAQVIWVLVVLFLPLIGLIAWFFLGPRSRCRRPGIPAARGRRTSGANGA